VGLGSRTLHPRLTPDTRNKSTRKSKIRHCARMIKLRKRHYNQFMDQRGTLRRMRGLSHTMSLPRQSQLYPHRPNPEDTVHGDRGEGESCIERDRVETVLLLRWVWWQTALYLVDNKGGHYLYRQRLSELSRRWEKVATILDAALVASSGVAQGDVQESRREVRRETVWRLQPRRSGKNV